MRELRRIAGEFLAQGQRRRILQMGAADLDDGGKAFRLCRECRLERVERGQNRAPPSRPRRRSSPSEIRHSTIGRD
jgi:hypothetical protein